MDLFSLQEADAREGFEPGADMSAMPLAARMRPRTLDEVAGQKHLLAPGKLLRRAIETDRFTSLIFTVLPAVERPPWPLSLHRRRTPIS